MKAFVRLVDPLTRMHSFFRSRFDEEWEPYDPSGAKPEEKVEGKYYFHVIERFKTPYSMFPSPEYTPCPCFLVLNTVFISQHRPAYG